MAKYLNIFQALANVFKSFNFKGKVSKSKKCLNLNQIWGSLFPIAQMDFELLQWHKPANDLRKTQRELGTGGERWVEATKRKHFPKVFKDKWVPTCRAEKNDSPEIFEPEEEFGKMSPRCSIR